MKKKAIISTVASVVLAGVMCVGFAACGGESAKSLKGEEVDKATWDAAFENEEVYDNFKLEGETETISEMTFGTDTVKVTLKSTGAYIYADRKTHTKGITKTSVSGNIPDEAKDRFKEGSVDTDYYVDESGDTKKYVAKVDGNWANVTEDTGFFESAIRTLNHIFTQLLPSTEYGDYVYSTEYKGYVAKDAEEGDPLVAVKFKGGKLKAVYAEFTDEEQGSKMIRTYSYMLFYGGQSVKLPSIA